MSETQTIDIETLLAERDWLRGLARRLVADAGAADDLVQETWVAALTNPPQPPRHGRGMRGWLATVLRRRAHDVRLRTRRERRRDERSARSRVPEDPAEIVARAELEQRVAKLTLDLPESYRTTLLMRYHRGLSPKEIAERLGEPSGTVRSRLKRGLAMLRDRLDRDRGGDRRRWALALLPLARGSAPEALMLTFTTKLVVATSLLLAAGIGSAVLLGVAADELEPEPSRKLEVPLGSTGTHVASGTRVDGDAPSETGASAPADPAGAPGQNGKKEKNGKKGAPGSPLDQKIDVDFQGESLDEVIAWLSARSGVQITIEPGFRKDLETVRVGLTASRISLRDLLHILLAYAGPHVSWTETAKGFVSIRVDPSKRPKPQPVPTPPWFGARRGLFVATPIARRTAPEVQLPDADMAKAAPAAPDRRTIALVLGKDGSFHHDGEAVSPHALWLLFLDRPDAPVLIRADREAPLSALDSLARIVRGRTIDLALAEGRRLRVRPRPATAAKALRVQVMQRRDEIVAEELYGQVWRIRESNKDRPLYLLGILRVGATIGTGVQLLNEADRFGCSVRWQIARVERREAPDGPSVRCATHGGASPVDGAPPTMQPGVALGEIGSHEPAAVTSGSWSPGLTGRGARTNLRSEGGGGTSAALEAGLKWLVRMQGKDGAWGEGVEDTGLVLLSFLAVGEAGKTGQWPSTVRNGLEFLEASREPSPSAAQTLAEASALTGDARWRRAAEKAVARVRSPFVDRIARWCGVPVHAPREPVDGRDPISCFVRIFDGEAVHASESLAEAVNVFARPPAENRESLRDRDAEYVHDATLVLFQAGGIAWDRFNRAMKKAVLGSQVREGENSGSWEPAPGGSRIRETALRTATLTVYFRYSRLFRR